MADDVGVQAGGDVSLDDGQLEIAIDLKLIPYYGEPRLGEEDFLLRGLPRGGPPPSLATPASM